ncbi:MAG: hypothetical protein HY782_25060 [Chloroflexi bacterium]|nr:hypothetical protein [Chloroflexota bacterium]
MISNSSTILRQPWLNGARAAWVAMSVAALVALIVSTLISSREQLPTCATPNASCAPWSLSQEDIALAQRSGLPHELMYYALGASSVLPKLVFFVVGVIIFWRKSDDWIALMLSLMLTLFVTEGVQNLGAFMSVVNILYLVASVAYYLLPFVFPNGSFVPRWTRWMVPPLMIISIAVQSLNTLGVPVDDTLFGLVLAGTGISWFLLAGYAVIYRYARISTAMERQQTKWVMVGILGPIIVFIPFTIISLVFPPSQPSLGRLAFYFLISMPVGVLSYLLLAAGIGFAIFRYRLYDIDIIIRRTLVYTALTATLALVYFGSVVLLQQLLRAVTGQASELAIIVSTFAIAALFNPLRKRVQDTIDSRFYRRKYDAARVLAEFAATARDEVELGKLTTRLVEVVNETMQPSHVSLWLKK